MQRRFLALLVGLIGLVAAQRHAFAQAAGFAANRFEPSERGSDWFVGDSLDLRGAPTLAAGVVFDWAYRPLVLYDPADTGGKALGNVVTDQVLVHSGASLVFYDRFRIAVSLPVVLYQHGDDVSAFAHAVRSPDGSSLGDLRLSSDVRVLGHYGSAFTGALGFALHFPTGSRDSFTSDETLRFTPRLLIAGDGAGFAYAAKLAFAYRPFDGVYEGRELGSEAVFSAAGGVRVNDIFVFGPELFGSTVVTNGTAFQQRATPLELLLGLHLTFAKDWMVGTGIGPGFTRGDGTPSMRVTASIEWAPDVCVDPDGDSICDPVDACPDVAGLESADGCPEGRGQKRAP